MGELVTLGLAVTSHHQHAVGRGRKDRGVGDGEKWRGIHDHVVELTGQLGQQLLGGLGPE